ncbi:MAG: glycyl radical protein [Clostridia bacterium]|nr:glycyl radical protein [Clostridia bacterium]
MLTERVKKLRKASKMAKPHIWIERAKYVTDVYEAHQGKVSTPVLRAMVFYEILKNKPIFIGEGELIVGEKAAGPGGAPTYPELCCHELSDFDVMQSRKQVSFQVDNEAYDIQQNKIIPYWKERSIRHKIFENMSKEWKDAYQAGIFTEFLEQRAPGHTVADKKIFQKGFIDFKEEILEKIQSLNQINDLRDYDKKEQLKAMALSCDAIMLYAKRHSEYALSLAKECSDELRKKELLKIAEVCERVPAHAPRTYWEALQAYWFIHLGITTELNTWDAFSPGRLDQHLLPFYLKEKEAGTLDKGFAYELLNLFWIKFNNQPAPPKVGFTLLESATYTDFANIGVGGLTVTGEDAVNEMSYLILDCIDEMRLVQPSSNVQLSQKNPDAFIAHALKIIRKGAGQPSIFNADAVIKEMLNMGKSLEDAREGGCSGCVETGAFGKEAYILQGYFNLTKILEITLNNGYDRNTDKLIGLETGDPRNFKNYEELFEAYKKQLKYFLDIKIHGSNWITRLYAKEMPAPFMSVVIDDCIQSGKDYNNGGARYNTSYIQGVGIGTITDSLSAIKQHIFDDQRYSMDEMLKALEHNFENHELMRNVLFHKTRKYGNDDDYPDQLMQEVFNAFYENVNGRENPNGGHYRINMLPTTCHVFFGSVIGATPDGRFKGLPLSEGISPTKGADKHGPTAVIKSVSKMDHLKTGGTLLNQKFTPELLNTDNAIDALTALIRAYFKMNGHHIQFNVVRAETLKMAQMQPEAYEDLIVRVAGYSDYFNHLSPALQNEIISRTEHMGF